MINCVLSVSILSQSCFCVAITGTPRKVSSQGSLVHTNADTWNPKTSSLCSATNASLAFRPVPIITVSFFQIPNLLRSRFVNALLKGRRVMIITQEKSQIYLEKSHFENATRAKSRTEKMINVLITSLSSNQNGFRYV